MGSFISLKKCRQQLKGKSTSPSKSRVFSSVKSMSPRK